MSYIYPNVDPLFLRQRKGTENDPYIRLIDTNYVFQGAITLKEVPSFTDEFTVMDSNELEFNKTSNIKEIGVNEYFVDYTDGLVYFHPSHEGKSFTITYWGTGYISLPSTRIFVPNSSGDPLTTLQNILDNVEEGTAVIEQVKNIEFIGEYDPEAQYKKWNFVTFGNKTFVAMNTIQGLSPTESSDWKLVSSGVGFVGVFDPEKTYKIGDMVADENSKNIYFSKMMDNNYPLTDTGAWELMITLDDLVERIEKEMNELQEFQDILEASDLDREQNEVTRQQRFDSLLDDYQSFHTLVLADEEARNANEEGRIASEVERNQFEEIRQENELERISNENERKAAEVAREEAFQALISSIESNANTAIENVENIIIELGDFKTEITELISQTEQRGEEVDTRLGELSGLKPAGEFNIETAYNRLNIVSHEGSSYMAKVDTQGNDVTDEQFWFPLAKRGLDNTSISIDGVVPNQDGEIFIDDLDVVRGEDFERFSSDVYSMIGDVSALTTANSENVVEAINELNRKLNNIINVL